jgi:hypothetical protein
VSDKNQRVGELAHQIRESRPVGRADRQGKMARKDVKTMEPGPAFADEELQAIADTADGLDTPQRFPKIKSA